MNPLTFSEIDAWSRLTKTELSGMDVSILKMLDNLYLIHTMKKKD